MATVDQISLLRLLIAEPTTATYSDVTLGLRIDGVLGDMNLAARDLWAEKAAAYTALANISEGGSSRSMGDLQAKALKMFDLFDSRYKDSFALAQSGVIISQITR